MKDNKLELKVESFETEDISAQDMNCFILEECEDEFCHVFLTYSKYNTLFSVVLVDKDLKETFEIQYLSFPEAEESFLTALIEYNNEVA